MKNFEFKDVFTADGHIVSEIDGPYVSRAEVDSRVASARQETKKEADDAIALVLSQIAADLNPIVPALTAMCRGLRREAVELALAAAESIAGVSLDKDIGAGAESAVKDLAARLKGGPELVLSIPPEIEKEMRFRMTSLAATGVDFSFRLETDPAASLGDWRISWTEGTVAFNRVEALKIVREAIENHLSAPVDVQVDLFAGQGG